MAQLAPNEYALDADLDTLVAAVTAGDEDVIDELFFAIRMHAQQESAGDSAKMAALLREHREHLLARMTEREAQGEDFTALREQAPWET